MLLSEQTQQARLNRYRIQNRMSVNALANKIGIPAHVLRRFFCGNKPADYNQAAIDEFVEKKTVRYLPKD